MVPVITGRISENELLQPFDTSATDLAGYDSPQGTAVIRTEILAIHFVGQHDSPIGIHGPIEFDRCPVIPVWLKANCQGTACMDG